MKKTAELKTRTTKTFNGKSICFYFEVHQPYRLRNYNFFEEDKNYFHGPQQAYNEDIFKKVAEKCYLPTTQLLSELLERHPEFRVSFSLSGVFLEQCLEFGEIGKQVLESFQKLVKTGQVELLSETYYHSLTFLYSKLDYAEQIIKHRKLIKKLFGVHTKVFRNTELIYNNEIANFIKGMGFDGMLLEGWDKILGWRSSHHLMKPMTVNLPESDRKIAEQYQVGKPKEKFSLLLKDYRLSDDIAFRFGNKNFPEYPLTAEKFSQWLKKVEGETINLFMDFETFGEHQWSETGIFEFLKELPTEILKNNMNFRTPSETIKNLQPVGEVDCHHHLSWADMERDLSAWTGNQLQDTAMESIKKLESAIHLMKLSKKKKFEPLIDAWRKMQTSDHFYYMCLKYWHDGDVHKYFSPYESPYEAFISYMNVYSALRAQIEKAVKSLTPLTHA